MFRRLAVSRAPCSTPGPSLSLFAFAWRTTPGETSPPYKLVRDRQRILGGMFSYSRNARRDVVSGLLSYR